MAALGIFELPIDFEPDPDYVNVPPNYQYLAWRLSIDPQRGTSLWSIEQVAAEPDVTLEELLGEVEYTEVDVGEGTSLQDLGYTPSSYPTSPIDDQIETISTYKNYVQDELIT